jgi:hypothetical protein
MLEGVQCCLEVRFCPLILPFRFVPGSRIHFPIVILLWRSSGKVKKFDCDFLWLAALGLLVLCSGVSNARGMHPSAGNVPR